MDYPFLPAWPLALNPFLLFGVLLVAGIVGGRLARATPILPSITGFMIAGLLLGPSGVGLLDADLMRAAKPFVEVALGLILFQIGLRLDLRTIARPVIALSAVECLGTFVVVFAALLAMGLELTASAIAAAIAISASPAILLMVTRDFGASGPVTDLSVNLVALNNAISFLAFTALLPLLHWHSGATIFVMLLQPLYALLVSVVIALVLALALVWLARRTIGPDDDPMPLSAGFVVLAWGLADMLNAMPLLTLLALGLAVRYLEGVLHLSKVNFGRGGAIFFVILFVVAGANLHLGDLAAAGVLAVVFVGARALVKTLMPILFERRIGLTRRQSVATGMNLVPMAGMAIGIVELTYQLYPGFGHELRLTVFAAIVILETVGPVMIELALKLAGEISPEKKIRH